MASYSLTSSADKLELLTKENFKRRGPFSAPIEISEMLLMIQNFQDSKMNQNIRNEDSSFIEAFDIDKKSLFRVLEQPNCEGIRVFFSLLPDGKGLTLSFVGTNKDGDDLIYVDENAKIQGIAEDQVGKPRGKPFVQTLAKLFKRPEFEFLWT
ncbi:hypothetical protein SAMN05216327_101282 [Dyadobacter sp. SG02]|uniref:hypothetical protein n=1 Tax=Dyadobacter sp. SG02 TaxID=1855291 RepID=UPI0008BE4CDE|nr:hypothetical protein [Dyadobacter sp. SG02]SEI40434.1 hypothetical protein SAMN05216327_101282 [Dyadobacter sp. SG02]